MTAIFVGVGIIAGAVAGAGYIAFKFGKGKW